MLLKIIKYESGAGKMCHLCKDDNGCEHRVDLLVNGDFPKDIDPESLLGKTVEVGKLIPYLERRNKNE